jgi:hypothetical protein
VASLTALERDIVRRWRSLRGLRMAGVAFALAAGVVLVGSLAIRVAGVRPELFVLVGAGLGVGVASAAGCIVGRAGKPDLSRLLLSVDLSLGTGERLSSLFELRSRGTAPVLERRIEERLAQSPPAWKRALRVRLAELLPWLVGSIALAVALTLAAGVAPATSLAPLAPAEVPEGAPRTSSASKAEPPAPVGELAGSGTAAPLVLEQDGTTEPLVDALADLVPAPPSRGLLGPTEGALEEERHASGDGGSGEGESVSDFLSRIMSRNQDETSQDFDLTEEERETLEDLAEGLPDSPLRDALRDILGGGAGDEMKDRIAKAQELLGGLAPTEEGGDGDPLGKLVGAVEAGEALEGTGQAGEAPSNTGSDDNRLGAEPDETEVGTNSEPPETESPSSASSGERGGKAGRREGDGSPPPDTPGLVPAELLSEWGASGDVRRFMTKGLPFEPPRAGEDGSFIALPLDVEMLRSLLEARSLAPELQDLVRTYFETITQGEP